MVRNALLAAVLSLGACTVVHEAPHMAAPTTSFPFTQVAEWGLENSFVVRVPFVAQATAWLHDSGYIITAAHLFEGVDLAAVPSILLQLPDGSWVETRLVGLNVGGDVAVLECPAQINGRGLSIANEVLVGEPVMAFGSTISDDIYTAFGIVQRVDALWVYSDFDGDFGWSGGPLLNGRGEVVALSSQLQPGIAVGRYVVKGIPAGTLDSVIDLILKENT